MKLDFEKAVKSGVEQAMQEFYKMHYDQTIKTAKSEAVKEFAGRVIDLIYDADDINPVSEWQIRNLVKEMVGENE